MFKITSGRGFHMVFPNGWTVSVQFGAGNYCDNYYAPITAAPPYKNVESSTAEIAAWDKDGNWHNFDGDTVQGYQTPAEVLAFINLIAAKGN